jgi:hypothetical protein
MSVRQSLYAGTPSLVKRSPSHSKRLHCHVDSERGDQGCDVPSSFALSDIDPLSRGHHGPRKGILICFGFYLQNGHADRPCSSYYPLGRWCVRY